MFVFDICALCKNISKKQVLLFFYISFSANHTEVLYFHSAKMKPKSLGDELFVLVAKEQVPCVLLFSIVVFSTEKRQVVSYSQQGAPGPSVKT